MPYLADSGQTYMPYIQRRNRPIGMEGYQIGGEQTASMEPTMDQLRRADTDAVFAQKLAGNLQRAGRTRLTAAQNFAAAAPVVPAAGTDAMTRGEAQVNQKRIQDAQAITTARQGYVANAQAGLADSDQMLRRSQRARELGIAPNQVAAHAEQQRDKQKAQEIALAQSDADVALKRSQATGAILGGLGHLGQGIGAAATPFAKAYEAGVVAKENAAMRQAAMDNQMAITRERADATRYAADSRLAGKPDRITENKLNSLTRRMDALKTHLYVKQTDPSTGADTWVPNKDAQERYDQLNEEFDKTFEGVQGQPVARSAMPYLASQRRSDRSLVVPQSPAVVQQPGADEQVASPLPPPHQLIAGKRYMTPQGPGFWDGSNFILDD